MQGWPWWALGGAVTGICGGVIVLLFGDAIVGRMRRWRER